MPVSYGRYRGHRFDGWLRPTAAEMTAHLAAQGLDPAAGALLAAVSSLEGGFDALQTYGRGRMVWGCIQFTGTGGLPALMLRLRDWAPEQYATYFQAAGIDAAPGGLLEVRSGRRTWRGWQALTRLHDEPALWKPFLLAAHDPAIQAGQVRAAYEHYLLPARALTVTVAGQAYALGPLLAGHPLGEATLFDHAVSHGPAATRRLFQRAARQTGGRDPAALLAAAHALEPGDQSRWLALERALRVGTLD